ncbi:MAG: PH domain-containing protein [Nanoarchaeota archaeon]|nr:PH domain-containing protein [Nanoarchaeota archaeon]MBU4300423.1 PH domain-containing protein [Nanoarchaeota archaeon]MBU4451544.1 PH domain-containing protein [Nanoarchaeota archaeon]MCG2724029.1 PH domain-containing protein [archaeon]
MNEKMLLKFNSTRIAFLKLYLAGFVWIMAWIVVYFGIAGISIPATLTPYLFILPIIGLLHILWAEISIRVNRFYISDQRIAEKKGILSIEETYLQTDRVANYTIKQNFIERLLDIGTIEIESVDGDDEPEIVMKCVGGIDKIRNLLDSLISATKYGTHAK